jgi:hypothetical protein
MEKNTMADMSFPRNIFAIGGAGKNILYTTLEKEWILRELLKPKFVATTVDVVIIDTALDEENRDREKISNIENKIEKIEEAYRNDPSSKNKNVGRINISYMLLTKEMVLQSPFDLIGIGDKVKKATGSSIWWINDKQLGDDWSQKIIDRENFKELNFSKGVYRKRAIGKAIYYKALSEGLFDIDLTQTAQVDIIVGLGGGTGSGMAFDLAKKLKIIQPTANITLFGVLSTLDESPDEKTNNFAMISEIEHGYLNRNTPFKEVILVPMEVTRFPGREKASDEHNRLLEEFDETVPYMLVSYHNVPAERIFENVPDYAPFIIVTSQLVRYNVESMRKLKEMLIDAIGKKEISLKYEEDIYYAIKKFIDEFYKGIEGGSLPDEDKSFIKEKRFSKFQMVLDHEFFQELNYNSIAHLKKAVDAGIFGAGSDNIELQVSSVRAEVDTISIGNEGFREETDLTLYKVLKKDVEAIDELKNVLNLINKIPDNVVRDTLKTIAKIDEYGLGRRLNKIREEADGINARKRSLETTIKLQEEDIASYKEKINADVNTKDKEWRQNERKNIDLLDAIDDIVPALTNDCAYLEDQLNEYLARIIAINVAKNIGNESTRGIETILDKIYQELDKIGIYYEDKSKIIRSLATLKELRKSQIAVGKKSSVIAKLLKTKRHKDWVEAKNKLNLKIAELNDDNVFDAKNTISCVYKYNIDNKIDQKKGEIIDSIVKRVAESFPNTPTTIFSDLRNILKNPASRKDANIDDIVKSNFGYEEELHNKENELNNRLADASQISERMRLSKSLETLLKNVIPALRAHAKNLKNYDDDFKNIGKDVQAMYRAKKEIIRYIMEMEPTNIFKATISGANINNILEDQNEELAIKQNLKDGIDRTIDTRYNTLVRRVIETKDHMKRWERSNVMNSVVNIANINSESIGARETITNAFSIAREHYSEWKCPWGDSWGVGVVLFIAGVPLDNIRNVVDSRTGYYFHYKNIEETGIIFFHHSYMLEEGKFIKRKRVFNINDEDEKNLLLQDDKDIQTQFYQNYEEIDIKNCLPDQK